MTEAKPSEIKKGKGGEYEQEKYLTRKFKQVVESFKKKGDDTSEEGEGNEEAESDHELKLPEVIGVSLNLSKKKLKIFAEEYLERMHRIQYLYLEGNKLTELPQNFFQSLFFLKWLDLRNNSLVSLPTNGLKNHPCLEVILLQGNRIRILPVELATISSLKGLQITGNPITNVPYEIIAEGFQPIMKYLEKLASQEETSVPLSNTIVMKPSTSQGLTIFYFQRKPKKALERSPKMVALTDYNSAVKLPVVGNEPTDSELRMWDLEKLSQWRHFMKKKSETVAGSSFRRCLTKFQKPNLQQPKISISVRSQPKLPTKPQPFRCGVYNRNRHKSAANARRYLKMRKTTLGYKKKPITVAMIQEKARNDAYKAQVREILEKQAKKIQRLRDREVLKSWRDHAKITSQQMKYLDNYQQYPSKDFANKTPFDVDPEFLNMLNRVDLYRSLKDYDNRSKRKKKVKVRITAQDLEKQMNEIIKKLQELETDDVEESESPRAKHTHMCHKMSKIMDIQKTLKNLQALNTSMAGITPIMKPKCKE